MIKKVFLFIVLTASGVWAVQDIPGTVSSLKDTSITLKWSFPRKVVPQVYYGESLKECNKSVIGFEASKNVELQIDGLKPGTLYYFKADFFATNNIREFFHAGYFISSGRKQSRIEDVIIKNGMNDSRIWIMCANPLSGTVLVSRPGEPQRTFNVVPDGKVSLAGDLGAAVPCVKFAANLTGLKPLSVYNVSFQLKDDLGQTVKFQTNIQTLENNLALKKPVSGTFNSTYIADKVRLSGDILARVTDGSMDYLNGMAVSEDPELSDQWVIVDLQKEYPVSKVTAFWRAMAYPFVYQIDLGTDGKTWRISKTVKSSQENTVLGNMPMKVDGVDFKGENARYIRLFLPQKTPCFKRYDSYKFVELMELKVYGSD